MEQLDISLNTDFRRDSSCKLLEKRHKCIKMVLHQKYTIIPTFDQVVLAQKKTMSEPKTTMSFLKTTMSLPKKTKQLTFESSSNYPPMEFFWKY